MENQKAIEYLEPLTHHPTLTGSYADALKSAVVALREQAEREKGCEYCDPEVMSGNPIFSRHADGYLGNGKFCSDAGVGVKAYFCPRCGRRLK